MSKYILVNFRSVRLNNTEQQKRQEGISKADIDFGVLYLYLNQGLSGFDNGEIESEQCDCPDIGRDIL